MASPPAHATPPSSVPKSARRAAIYIVDENPVTRETLRALLAREGYTIHDTAGGAADSLRLLDASSTPLIVLLGLWRPGGWGEEVYEALLTGGRRQASHIYILLWARPAKAALAAAARLSASYDTGVLGKPFDLASLLVVVAEASKLLPSSREV
jgi:CheY-like chemotaxis protein